MIDMIKHMKNPADIGPFYMEEWQEIVATYGSSLGIVGNILRRADIPYIDANRRQTTFIGGSNMLQNWPTGWTLDVLPYLPRAQMYMRFAMRSQAYESWTTSTTGLIP